MRPVFVGISRIVGVLALSCLAGLPAGALAADGAPVGGLGGYAATPATTARLTASAARGTPIRFDLIGEKGRVTQDSYPGKYLLLTIGYTNCPDICPATMYEYSEAMRLIKNPDAIQPLFVSIDPVGDDMDYLKIYTRHFDERIVGLSGELKAIRALTDQLGATFGYRVNGKKVEVPMPGADYTVYHSGFIYLISPERKLVDVYDYQIGPKGLAEALDKALAGAPRAPASAPDKSGKTGEAASPAAVRSAPSSCLLPAGFTAVKNGLALHEVLPEAGKGGALDEAAGKPVLLNLWAIWCAPCRVELPALDRLATARKDMVVQTLNLGDAPAGIAALFAKMNIRALPQTRSDDAGLPARLGAAGLPFTALFVDGRQVASRSGIVTSTEAVAAFAQCHAARAAAPGRPR